MNPELLTPDKINHKYARINLLCIKLIHIINNHEKFRNEKNWKKEKSCIIYNGKDPYTKEYYKYGLRLIGLPIKEATTKEYIQNLKMQELKKEDKEAINIKHQGEDYIITGALEPLNKLFFINILKKELRKQLKKFKTASREKVINNLEIINGELILKHVARERVMENMQNLLKNKPWGSTEKGVPTYLQIKESEVILPKQYEMTYAAELLIKIEEIAKKRKIYLDPESISDYTIEKWKTFMTFQGIPSESIIDIRLKEKYGRTTAKIPDEVKIEFYKIKQELIKEKRLKVEY